MPIQPFFLGARLLVYTTRGDFGDDLFLCLSH